MADITMVMVGDNYVQRKEPDTAFAPARPYLKDADIGFCNLETVIADAKYLAPHDHDKRPRTDEWIFPYYLKAGFNVFNIANNPVWVHGRDCFNRSLDVLDAAGAVYGGGGRNIAAARKPAVIEKKGTKVAFVCRTSVGALDAGAAEDRSGVARFRVSTHYEMHQRAHEVPGSPPIIHTVPNPQDKDDLAADIRTARELADVVVLSWHWGVSHASGGHGDVVGYQKEMAHFAIDQGVNLVVGHHPHEPQPIEAYKGAAIVYSLGNYMHDMSGMRGFSTGHHMMAQLMRVAIQDGKITRVAFVPGAIANGNGPPDFFRPADAPDVVRQICDMAAPFGTKFEVGADDVAVVLS
jgi:poly-gamma-glutamate capsule biosynthesis protein CapA/YwtB (metallophosphatase superfamily)